METLTQQQSVCFAYFGDNKFLGWYSDTSGSISANSPKVYSYLDSMLPVITKNFRNKFSRVVNPINFEHEPTGNAVNLVLGILDAGNKDDLQLLADYETIELRAVGCPVYDGPNPDFDKVAYEQLCDEHTALFNSTGINELSGIERFNAVQEFNKTTPHPKANNWIFADYTKVQEWALNEPTEFLTVITRE